MKLELKLCYADTNMSCPFTGKYVNLRFLPESMYIHYYNKGFTYLFDIETFEIVNEEDFFVENNNIEDNDISE